ncbi:MAG: flagellin [Bacteroidota bacterium]
MRVTQNILFGNFIRDINKNRGEQAELQSNLSTGKTVRVASQDPVSFQRSRVIEENIRKEEQFQSNIDNGLRQGRLVQETLDNVIDRLIEVKEVSVRGSSDSLGESNRESIANQLEGIRDSLINSFNLSYGDRYLFAGTNSGQIPFQYDEVTDSVINNSNANAPRIQAGDGITVEISLSGQDLTATPGGDLFEIIGDIEEAMRNNDQSAINAQLGRVDDMIEHVTDLTSQLGNNINRLDFLNEQYESLNITQQANVSELVDTDYAQAFSDLQRKQVAYDSAMAVHSTMFNNTLLDYL